MSTPLDDNLKAIKFQKDNYIVPDNVKQGIRVFGVDGDLSPSEDVRLQSKTIVPGNESKVLLPDSGYDALASVNVSGDANLKPENIRKDVTVMGVTGTLDPDLDARLQSKRVTPKKEQQAVRADSGYDGLSTVTVYGDNNLIAENIKNNTTIFGVTGNYTGGGEGGEGFNVFIQENEPSSKSGVWIKSSFTTNKVYFTPNYTKQGRLLINNLDYLNPSQIVLGQCVVGDYLYSFSSVASMKSCCYNLNTRQIVKYLNVPETVNASSSYRIGAIYFSPTDEIFVFWLNGDAVYYYAYNIGLDTYSSTTYLCGLGRSNGSNCMTIWNDRIYLALRSYGSSGGYSSDYGKQFVRFNPYTKTVEENKWVVYGDVGYMCANGQYMYGQRYGTLYRWDCATMTQTSIKSVGSGEPLYSASRLLVNGNYMYVFWTTYNSGYVATSRYAVYDMSTWNYQYVTSSTPYWLPGDYPYSTSSQFQDYTKGVFYLREKGYNTMAFQYYDNDLESYRSDSPLIVQDVCGSNITRMQNESGLYMGIKDAYIVREQNGEKYLGDYMTCWGNGENWVLLKNPSNETCTVTFNSNGGTSIPSKTIVCGQMVAEPTVAPTKIGEVFIGWYLNGELYDFSKPVISSITLNAQYEAYENVEYIQSTGTQFVNTKIATSNDIEFDFDFQLLELVNDRGVIGSRRSGGGSNERHSLMQYNNQFHFMIGNTAVWNMPTDTLRHQVSISKVENHWVVNADGIDYVSSDVSVTASTEPYYIFKNGSNEPSSMRLYSATFYSNGNSIGNFVPIKLTDTNEYCLMDTISNKIFRNMGTGKFIGDDYEPTYVSYIQNTGYGYIDTGVKPVQETRVETKFEFTTANQTQYAGLFGSQNDGSNTSGFTFTNTNGNALGLKVGSGSYISTVPFAVNVPFIIQGKFNELEVNGATYTGTNTWVDIPYSMFIFARNSQGSVLSTTYTYAKLYYFKIYEDENIIRDFVPCLDFNNTPCLWDKVTKQFFYNKGSGTFSYGS